MRAGLLLSVLILGLSGCAVMTPEQCEYADWTELGERDAREGRPSDYLATRARACGKVDIAPDPVAYRIGWERGIVRYCTADQGFLNGINGRVYTPICPAHLEPDYLISFNIGAELYRARTAVEVEDRAIRNIEATLADPGDRTDQQIRDLERDLDRRRDRIRVLERELGLLEGQATMQGYRFNR